jgi:hypothetical protein
MEFVQLCGSWDESPSACVMHPLKRILEQTLHFRDMGKCPRISNRGE